MEIVSRYIDADELKKLVEEEFKGVCVYDVSPDEAISDFCDVVDNCSSVDVAPVVHGRWIRAFDDEWQRCSVCNILGHSVAKFCPNCGAKMDEEESGNA